MWLQMLTMPYSRCFRTVWLPQGGAVGPLGGKRVVGRRDIFILIEIWAQEKIYMLVGNLLGWNMKHALLSNLNFTKVYINTEKLCYSLTELYVKSVYLNLLGWRVINFWNNLRGAVYKSLGISALFLMLPHLQCTADWSVTNNFSIVPCLHEWRQWRSRV
jgi:hypothetical protein